MKTSIYSGLHLKSFNYRVDFLFARIFDFVLFRISNRMTSKKEINELEHERAGEREREKEKKSTRRRCITQFAVYYVYVGDRLCAHIFLLIENKILLYEQRSETFFCTMCISAA